MKYCMYCGRQLRDDEECTCRMQGGAGPGQDFSDQARRPVGDSSDNGAYERNRQIVGDCVMPMEGEVPVKQYDLAILRTIFPFKRAEGRLQVTNKRVLFRAAGRSWLGRILCENEFALDEIAGIDVRRDKRVNRWYVVIGILCLILAIFLGRIISPSGLRYSYYYGYYGGYSVSRSLLILGLLFAAGGVVLAILLRNFHWVKEIVFIMSGCFLINHWMNTYRSFWMFLGIVAYIVGIVFLIMFAIKDDLVLHVKLRDGLDAFDVKKREAGSVRHRKSNTGFAEVMPWTDTDAAVIELGALISDLQQHGDEGVRKWRQ